MSLSGRGSLAHQLWSHPHLHDGAAMVPQARPLAVARHAALALRTAWSLAAEDPALFAVQVARRLPRPVAGRLARGLRACGPTGSTPRIVGCWLAGWRDEARDEIAVRAARGRLGRVVGEVAVELDALDPATRLPATTAARAAWRRGDLTVAVATAPAGSTLRRRLRDELRLLARDEVPNEGRSRKLVPRPELRPSAENLGRGGRLTVLHLLVNSVPTTASGYALRSHAVLRAQRGAGIDAVATTRLGYPVNVGLVTGRDLDVVDQVPYHRLVRWSAPGLPSGRLEAQVVATTDLAVRCGAGAVHATTPFTNGLVAQRVAARLGLPWVYEVRGLLEDTWAASFPTPAARRAASASQRHALARAREAELAAAADHVVVLGTTVRDSLVARGVPAERITVVPNAVDDALLTCDTDPATARARLGLGACGPAGGDTDGFWVGTVGSLVDYEGVGTLLDAVTILRAQGVDVRVAVVGDGVARPELVRRAAALGEAAVLPGRVPAAQAVTWYQALDVFVVPRRDTAVTRTVVPLKPMQAMALRRPVVASDLPALREVVGDPGAGLMVPPDDADALAGALAALAADPDRVARLGAAGRRFAATRTWSAVGQAYRALYERLYAPADPTPGEGLAA
ncbi:MAG: glycosyltransferase [Micrococcales bacterium]|nr:glycosyltransferase [Micrococcales bacterium]